MNDTKPWIERAAALAASLLASIWIWVIPISAFLALFVLLCVSPLRFIEPTFIDLGLPSEHAIPPDVAQPNASIGPRSIRWTFRYAPIGAETQAGVPFWIFQVMPKLLPDKFDRYPDYRQFGFSYEENKDEFYVSRSLPRGLVLTDSGVDLPGFPRIGVSLKRVTINCSSCHRGIYDDGHGTFKAVDGMPNHTADLEGFKRLFREGFKNPAYTADRVLAAIDDALHDAKAAGLSGWERTVYRQIVEATRGTDLPNWMISRPKNGPGRIDAFNAMKIEVIKADDDHTVATTDFPSIWNQEATMRPRHHWDGNTSEITTRDFGAVVGIGGQALTIDRDNVDRVGAWINRELTSPEYPFAPPAATLTARGLEVFANACASCHGFYDRKAQTVTRAPGESRYMQTIPAAPGGWQATDPQRLNAFGADACRALNKYGEGQGLWTSTDFVQTNGYLAGPLDGVWARAPYLHNGSVPTIRELLKPPAERVARFYSGNAKYNEADMGWVYDDASAAGVFPYETGVMGNRNDGHDVPVREGDREALIAYLKTL